MLENQMKKIMSIFLFISNFLVGILIGWLSFSSFSLDSKWINQAYYLSFIFGLVPLVIIYIEYLIFGPNMKLLAGFILSFSMYSSYLMFWFGDGGYYPFGFVAWLVFISIIIPMISWITLRTKMK